MRNKYFELSHTFSVSHMGADIMITILENGGTIGPRVYERFDGILVKDGFIGIYPENTIRGSEGSYEGNWEFREILIAGAISAYAAYNVSNNKMYLVRKKEDLNVL